MFGFLFLFFIFINYMYLRPFLRELFQRGGGRKACKAVQTKFIIYTKFRRFNCWLVTTKYRKDERFCKIQNEREKFKDFFTETQFRIALYVLLLLLLLLLSRQHGTVRYGTVRSTRE